MIVAFSIGTKCALMLPRKVINPQMTPAKGLIINKLLNHQRLVLVEEVWQFRGLQSSPLTEMCMSTGEIRQANWGWQELPQILDQDDYLIIPTSPHNILSPSTTTLDVMIRKSIVDFKNIKGFI